MIYADPAQPYLPDALRRERAALLPRGELVVLPGGHHLHMEATAGGGRRRSAISSTALRAWSCRGERYCLLDELHARA